MKERVLGKHLIIELDGCQSRLLNNLRLIRKVLVGAAKAAGLKIVAKPILHQFKPQGVAGVLLLQISHITIHTWPEFGYAAVDIFICNESELNQALDFFKQVLKPKSVRIKEIYRGPEK